MEKQRHEWKVGLFVLIGLVLAAALLLQFSKGLSLLRPTYTIYLMTKSVGSVKVNAPVLMAGVPVGTVSDIELNPEGRNATLTLNIYEKYTIHQDARFVLEQANFLGDQYVAIHPTTNAAPPFPKTGPPGRVQALEPFNIQEVARSAAGFIQRIDETARKLNDAISDVRRLLLNEQTLTNIASAVVDLRTASQSAMVTVNNINSLVATNGQSMSAAVSNVVYFSQQLNSFANSLGGVLSTNSAQLTVAMENVQASTAALKTLLSNVQAGKGLAGTVLTDPVLASNVQAIAENLSITTSNLNEHGIWGILWAKKHPKPPPSPENPVLAPKHPLH